MFNLINILGQNTLPEQVEINKQNIAILADEVEKLGYQPKGVYDAETEYNHNDVVFYDNKLYVVTSDAAIVGVLPTNTTYWQQVTGDIRGQQGAKGDTGEAGADGTNGVDGKPVLWYNLTGILPNIAAFNTLLTESSHSFTKAYFSRVGDVGDEFIYFIYIADSKTSLAMIYKIATWPEGVNSCTAVYQNVYASMTGQKGDTGATGKEALVYGRKINFTWNGETEQLLSGLSLSFQDFNRVPELNEDFVAILHDTVSGVDYLAMGEVQTISGENVTSIVATDINRISGINGTNGNNGTDGKDALVYGSTVSKTYNPDGIGTEWLSLSNFSRTPVVNEQFIVVWKNSSTNKSFIAIERIDSISGNYAGCVYVSAVETTGAAGQSAPTRYEHNIEIYNDSSNVGGFTFSINFINDNNTVYSSLAALADAIYQKISNRQIIAGGYYNDTTSSNKPINTVYMTDLGTYREFHITYTDINSASFKQIVISNATVRDTVYQI